MILKAAMLRHGGRFAVASAAVAVLMAACGAGNSGTVSGTTNPPQVADGVIDGLCLARQQAGDDPGAAKATFFDTAHEGLHDLARSLEELDDRGAAADVLQAKQAVEAALESGGQDLAPDIDALLEATSVGLDALGLPAPSCEGPR